MGHQWCWRLPSNQWLSRHVYLLLEWLLGSQLSWVDRKVDVHGKMGSYKWINGQIDWASQGSSAISLHPYAFSTDFQCRSSCDVNSVIGLTKFGNLENWYTCICIQCHTIWCRYGLDINFQYDFNHDVLYAIWRLFCHIIQWEGSYYIGLYCTISIN